MKSLENSAPFARPRQNSRPLTPRTASRLVLSARAVSCQRGDEVYFRSAAAGAARVTVRFRQAASKTVPESPTRVCFPDATEARKRVLKPPLPLPIALTLASLGLDAQRCERRRCIPTAQASSSGFCSLLTVQPVPDTRDQPGSELTALSCGIL